MQASVRKRLFPDLAALGPHFLVLAGWHETDHPIEASVQKRFFPDLAALGRHFLVSGHPAKTISIEASEHKRLFPGLAALGPPVLVWASWPETSHFLLKLQYTSASFLAWRPCVYISWFQPAGLKPPISF